MPIRILLVDDHSIMRQGLSKILSVEDDFEVVGEANSGEEALRIFTRLRPDVSLIDLKLAGMSGVELISEIVSDWPQARTMILSCLDRGNDIFRAIRAGAVGYLVKDAPIAEIFGAIRSAHSGHRHFPSSIAEKLADRLRKPTLTPRELEVINLLAKGMSNKAIAEVAYVTPAAVKYHVNNILSKLEARDRTQAVVAALKYGLVDLD